MATLSRENANDNKHKNIARDFFCSLTNGLLGNDNGRYKMLELLGTGIGAQRYSKDIVGLNQIDAVEFDPKKCMTFRSANVDPKIIPIYGDICHQISRASASNVKYDIINMDFCQFFYPDSYSGKTLSAGDNMRHLFSSAPFKEGSLIFVTFLVNGFQVAMSRYKDKVITDSTLICNKVKEIAAEYNVFISEAVDTTLNSNTYLYRPGPRGWNQMMHAGFVVDSIG